MQSQSRSERTALASLPIVRRYGIGLLASLALLVAAFWWRPQLAGAAARLTAPDPVTAAWAKAKAAGSYHFTSDVLQKTIPVASLTNVGRTSHTDAFHLEGQNDLRQQTLELTLWHQGGSVLNAASGISVRTAGGKTFTRRGNEAWQATDNQLDAFAPQGDFLGYLAAIRNVSTGIRETRNGISFTRYTFELDGPAFAAYMHEQMLAALRAKGELPAGVQLEPPAYYRDMTGSGELWVTANGLPLRQILKLRFPEQNDNRVEASMTVDFAKYGAEQTGLLTLLRTGQWQGAWLVLPQRLPDFTGLWLALLVSAACLLGAVVVLVYRQRRTVYIAIVTAVIFAEVAGPLLNTLTQVQFFDAYRAKAAAQEEQQATAQSQRELQTKMNTAPEFNPHQNPLETRDLKPQTRDQGRETNAASPVSALRSQVSSLQSAAAVTDPGTDTDKDGLTDFTEVRVGTSEVISDTDDDGLPDKLEVDGFKLDNGQTWYTDPNATDSNNDGLSDVVEWGIDSTTALPQATPRDTDGDGLPDLFDPDNDNDGVPDRDDTAPFAQSVITFTATSPLQLTINNLAPDKPAFVDFQIRPQDPKNLWFAYNVLDWPQDNDGQVRDIDNTTYADVAAAQSRAQDVGDANGDMKLVPMLEIRIPAASANLPSQAELTPFNITVNDFTADGSTKVAYVPLTIVTDPLTGERVAFSGQMRYKPTGSWTAPHSVRLAWVVQALNDLPCDPKAAEAAAQGCQSDGYIHNYPSMIHAYYDNWTLTGLSVREDHGASMAILYEDPTVDPDKKDEAPLWGLTDALSEHYLKPHDANNDGVRDLQLSDFPARFDLDNNPSDAQRFAIPNILQVVKNDYTTSDEATMSAAMTETVKILDTAFKSYVQADNAIKPLLLFVQENNLRGVGLDQLVAGEGYATLKDTAIRLDLAPTAASALPVTVNATLKWMAYCGAEGNNVTWRPCTSDEYASVIEGRYANAPSLPDDTEPTAVPGRMMLALSYYSTLVAGYQAQLQEGPIIASSRYQLEGESDTATRLRIGFNSIAPLPQIIMQSFIHLMVASLRPSTAPILVQIKATIRRLGKTYYDLQKLAAQADQLGGLKAGEEAPPLTKALIKMQKVSLHNRLQLHFARFAAAAPVGGAVMLLFNVLSQVPELGAPARAVLGTLGALVTAGVTIYLPAATAAGLYKLQFDSWASTSSRVPVPKPTLAQVLKTSNLATANARLAFGIGLVVNIALIWGFYAYAAGTSSLAAGSPELNKAAAEAVASTIVAILLAVLSATFIGTIIVGIITVIDLILNLFCELGADQLRIQGPVYGGACFSISTTATKVLAYLLYNYEPMIDTSRSDLMVTGAPAVTLADLSKGYVPSNTLTINLPVTTTVVHKSPDPSAGLYINYYLWLFSKDNLKSSTFKYGLTQSGAASLSADLSQMTDAWQDVTEDHKYVLTPMYRGVAQTDPAALTNVPLVQGINSPVPFNLTMSFAVPAYQCFWVLVPVCHTRELENTNTLSFSVLKYDVFPNTLAAFVALGPKADGGLGQKWDAHIGSLRDADGDGLNGTLFNGLDPDDTTWDADGDGLSDRFELERRAAGVAYSPLLRDTDNDGLTDKQEAEIGTDPSVADTDNDGLSDGVEVRHQVIDANGKLTNTWAGGWQVTLNTPSARTIWVSSDPFNADGDEDGISDQAEKALAANADPTLQVDDQGMPYNPNVPNTPPLAVFTASNALFGYVAPNQTFQYTSTVVANVPVAPGVLNVNVPAALGSAPAPATLPFDPVSFSNSQTMTVVSNLTVAANTPVQSLALTSTATTRLPNSGAPPMAWTPATTETPLGSAGRNGTFINGTAVQLDRQDSYRLIGQAVVSPTNESSGDILAFDLPGGTSRHLEVDLAHPAQRIKSAPTITCNNLGVCLAVWSELPSGSPPRIAAALFAPDGTVRSTFAVSAPTAVGDSAPVVASDGVNFLVAWQRLEQYIRRITSVEQTTAFRTELMTRLYDGSGAPLTDATLLPNERLEFWSTAVDTLSALNRVKYTLNRIDLDWVGDRYRLTRGINLGDAVGDPFVKFEDNGVFGSSTQLLTWRDIDAAGALIAGSRATVYNDATNGAISSYSLVYNPSTNEVLLFQTHNFDVIVQRFRSPADTSPLATDTIARFNSANAVATYYAPLRGYLIGWTDTRDAEHTFRYQVRDRFFGLIADQQQLTWPVAVDATHGTALACPAAPSVPVAEFRFEELPGAGAFVNASAPFEFPGVCDAGGCPAAGFPGAPAAPRSDYAVQFDGVDDSLSVNTSAPDSFTVALWVKAARGSNSVLVEQGYNLSKGWALLLSGGMPGLLIGSLSTGLFMPAFKPVDDGAWHFVAATRNGVTGDMALYVDGAQVSTRVETTPTALDAASKINIGRTSTGNNPFQGQMDQLQIYQTALSASTVQGLYNRSLQSYCVAAAAVPATGTNFPWSRLSLAEQDTRGGRISASGGLRLQVDATKPTASLTSVSNNAVVGVDQVIGGSASDVGVGVALVEVSVNGGAWQLANGAATWSFSLAGLSGPVSLRARATDLLGNIGDPSAAVNVTIDNTPPTVTITPPAGTIKPTKNAAGQWQVPLSGTATDANGVKDGSILVKLTQTSGVGVDQTPQVATGNWSINYLLDKNLYDPTGSYTVTVQADDKAGNRTIATPILVHLDAAGPVANLSANDTARTTITQTVTIGGVVSDTNSVVGIQKLEIAFTPIEQVAALSGNITSTQVAPQLAWTPVTLAQSGAGVAQTTWSFALPTGLENSYQIDLRGTDMLGNVSISANLWRGTIDTQNPRVAMSATATGASYFDAASNQTLYETRFVCDAIDRNLREESFICPGNALQPPVRSFTNEPALQALFPDLTIRSRLTNTYTLWSPTTTPTATVSACDSLGHCAQANTPTGGVARVAAAAVLAAPIPGAPVALVVNPTQGRLVAAGNVLSVTVAAEAGQSLKTVTLSLDNQAVQTLSFAQTDHVTRTLRTLGISNVNEGSHIIVAQATDWANVTQITRYPVAFTLDQNAPVVTIDPSALTLASTWEPGSGVLRFHGNASDSVGLAAVQIREGANPFVDATFGNGDWRVALPVADPEGRTLNITVRAIDRAGRITQVNQALATVLSAADAPDTRISSGPANPGPGGTPTNSATFVFTGTVSAVTFECSLDNGVYQPCASPQGYPDLSKGSHTFRVRAIDRRGLPDLSPAEFTWTVNAGQPDATLTGKPANPTTDRTASFTFTGDATATRFECSLDGGAYSACTSPKVYSNVGNGDHTFLVRARNSANVAGAADRYTWTVLNAAPVANNQSVVVIPNQAKAVTLTATDSDPLVYTIVTPPTHGVLIGLPPNVTYSPNTNYGGVDSFTFKANDGLADSNVATVTLFVDNVPPVVTCSVTPNNLWPPNHKLANIQATVTVTDVHSGPAGFTLVSVTSSEADSGLDAADVPVDIQNWVAGTPDVVGQLRAERSDTGPGRTYTLTYRGKDVAGNTALCTTTVKTPKSQGGRAAATYAPEQAVDDPFTAPSPTMETAPDAQVVESQPGVDAQTQQLFLPVVTVAVTVASESVSSGTVNREPEGAPLPTSSPALTSTVPLTGTVVVTATASAAQPSSAAGNVVTPQIYLPWVTATSQ